MRAARRGRPEPASLLRPGFAATVAKRWAQSQPGAGAFEELWEAWERFACRGAIAASAVALAAALLLPGSGTPGYLVELARPEAGSLTLF